MHLFVFMLLEMKNEEHNTGDKALQLIGYLWWFAFICIEFL